MGGTSLPPPSGAAPLLDSRKPSTERRDALDKKERNRKRGREARESGADFEAAVDSSLRVLHQQGVITWCQVNRPGKHGASFAEATGADRSGLLPFAIGWAMEVKSVQGDRLPRKRLTELQIAHLDATHRCGGLALLAVQFRHEPPIEHTVVLVPWALVPWKKLRKQQVLERVDVGSWRIGAADFAATFYHHARRFQP